MDELMTDYLQAAVATFFCTIAAITLLRPLAVSLKWVDVPNLRKSHQGNVVLTGGAAIFLALTAVCIVKVPMSGLLLTFLAAGLLLVAAGAVDDRYGLQVLPRLLIQIAAALIAIQGNGVAIESLGNLLGFGEIQLGVFAVPFTVVAIVGVVNAFNMVDGIDGLAGGLCLIALGFVAVFAQLTRLEALFLISLCAALMAFLLFNLSVFGQSRKVFLGDAGSMLLGFVACWLLIRLSRWGGARGVEPAVALWIVALPLLDMWAVMGRRLMARVSPFNCDRDHLHHILMRAGFSGSQALVCILLFALGLGAAALLAVESKLPESALFYGFIGLLVVHTTLIRRASTASWLFRQSTALQSVLHHGLIGLSAFFLPHRKNPSIRRHRGRMHH